MENLTNLAWNKGGNACWKGGGTRKPKTGVFPRERLRSMKMGSRSYDCTSFSQTITMDWYVPAPSLVSFPLVPFLCCMLPATLKTLFIENWSYLMIHILLSHQYWQVQSRYSHSHYKKIMIHAFFSVSANVDPYLAGGSITAHVQIMLPLLMFVQ